MIKAVVLSLVSAIAGVLMASALIVVSALFTAFILGFVLDPFLALINVPFLTERLGGLGFGRLFLLVFTVRLLAGVFIPGKPGTKTGENE
jgi:hypothetical protein